MEMKLYKPGQGYWTRMVSGIAAGVLVLAGGLWLFEKLSVLDTQYKVYFQAAALVLTVLPLGWLVYRWVGVKPKQVDFLISTEGEMKKVNWPARKEVSGSTWVVIWCVILLTILLFVSDFLFSNFFQFIGVLDKPS